MLRRMLTILHVSGHSGAVLDRRDWIYSLSLLVPFVLYDLTLKALVIASFFGDRGLASTLDLMRSNAIFDLGYALFWLGLFAATRGGRLPRRAVVVLFHAATMLMVLVSTSARQYYQETGTTLDYDVVALFLPDPGQVLPMFQGVSVLAWVLLAAALFYVVVGPFLVTRAVERRRGRSRRSLAGAAVTSSFLAPLGLFLLAVGFTTFSLLNP
ncbi:MAG: hypothetical protein M3259_10615, partial [Actinomycetota bacterium]|nr:hypothetical protein [Actinomycetota bacterium]